MSSVTQAFSQLQSGDPTAAAQLLPLVYDELRRLARAKFANERPGQTLDATALVHEAYLRLVGEQSTSCWNSRGHFFAAASEAMRRILIENARRKGTLKRGGDRRRIEFDRVDAICHLTPDQLLELDEVIDQLAQEDDVAAQLVVLRYFSGLSIRDAAAAIGISNSTAYRHWIFARAWLHSHLMGR